MTLHLKAHILIFEIFTYFYKMHKTSYLRGDLLETSIFKVLFSNVKLLFKSLKFEFSCNSKISYLLL